MAVALGGLKPVPVFDHVGEPETLNQRWTKWREELELFLMASGVVDPNQKKALLLHMGGVGLREVNGNFTDADRAALQQEDNADPYRQTKALFNAHFALRQNIPKARQNFLAAVPNAGETVNNFIVRLKTMAALCEYADGDNQIRDKVLLHIKDPSLRAKLLNEDGLTLARVTIILSNHHSPDALILGTTEDHVGKPLE